jgi:2-oxo-4-hydroxy-4-carboxy--5-ureidoimidazoline (OHCU) decarboxylase
MTDTEMVCVADLDRATAEEAARLLRPVCASARWIERLVTGRPHGSLSRLTAASDAAIAVLRWPDIEEALAAHPRIGDRAPRSGQKTPRSGQGAPGGGQGAAGGGQGAPGGGQEIPGSGQETPRSGQGAAGGGQGAAGGGQGAPGGGQEIPGGGQGAPGGGQGAPGGGQGAPGSGQDAPGGGRESLWSRQEQAAAAGAGAVVQAELRAGNAEYEERFGHVFLICAMGRSAGEMLAALRARLGNDPVAEREAVRAELLEIARLRLAKAFR